MPNAVVENFNMIMFAPQQNDNNEVSISSQHSSRSIKNDEDEKQSKKFTKLQQSVRDIQPRSTNAAYSGIIPLQTYILSSTMALDTRE